MLEQKRPYSSNQFPALPSLIFRDYIGAGFAIRNLFKLEPCNISVTDQLGSDKQLHPNTSLSHDRNIPESCPDSTNQDRDTSMKLSHDTSM